MAFKKGNKLGLGNKYRLGKKPWNKGLKTGFAPWRGKKRSEETKKKISEGRKCKYNQENHPQWKGEDACYVSIHTWVARWKGKPNFCEQCGTTKDKMYHWANIDHEYRRILDDYIRMCVPCHKKHDLERRMG